MDTEDGFDEMMERTFANFSDEVIGADVPIVDFRVSKEDSEWTVDDLPSGPQVPGEKTVLYDVAEDLVPVSSKNG
jgi:hypothetical protein